LKSQLQNPPGLSGATYCIVSAITYSISNISLRQLSQLDCDPMWVVFNKELFTVITIGVWLVWEACHGRKTLPSGRNLLWLIVVGLLVELVGNVALQWALGVVGLAVSIPASFGTSMTGGAILGAVFLREKVSLRSMAAMATLWIALVFLGIAAEGSGADGLGSAAAVRVLLGVGAACLAGTIFGLLGVTTCHLVRQNMSPMVIVFWVTLMAVFTLGPLSFARLGTRCVFDTSWDAYAWMVVTGLFNLIGFVALGKGYARTTLVHANVLNAGQVAMAAVAGIVLFRESPNLWLVLGVCLTIVGIFGAGNSPRNEQPTFDKQIADPYI